MFFDRSLNPASLGALSEADLYKALDAALSLEESELVWRLVDEIERRDQMAEF